MDVILKIGKVPLLTFFWRVRPWSVDSQVGGPSDVPILGPIDSQIQELFTD